MILEEKPQNEVTISEKQSEVDANNSELLDDQNMVIVRLTSKVMTESIEEKRRRA
jgi:hypothetical protein